MIAPSLLRANVFHKRYSPRVNAFTYAVYYIALPLSALEVAGNKVFGINRAALMSFQHRDHGARDGSDVRPWIRGVLARFGVSAADGEVVLIAHPRVLGHVFNPVSFWLCYDVLGELRAVLAEVNNTFGERHSYLLFHEDQRPIQPEDVLISQKCFHVSPFMHVEGEYHFQFRANPTRFDVRIDYHVEGALRLATSLSGPLSPLTGRAALGAFFAMPLVTLKTLALIHWQALKLVGKRVRYVPKPSPPNQDISR